MIQRNDAGCFHHDSTQTHSLPASEMDEFRRWLNRRNAARKQIRRLSPRELEVVMLVSEGLANKSIAQRLEISVKTIEKHRANAARKLGVGSTAEMVRLAVESDSESDEVTQCVPPAVAVTPPAAVHVMSQSPLLPQRTGSHS